MYKCQPDTRRIKSASDYQLIMTKLANSPITDTPYDIVVSLSGSFQLDSVVYDASDAVVSN